MTRHRSPRSVLSIFRLLAAWSLLSCLTLGAPAQDADEQGSGEAPPSSSSAAASDDDDDAKSAKKAKEKETKRERKAPSTSDRVRAQRRGMDFILPMNKMRFPSRIGRFKRVEIKEYEPRNWSVGYSRANPRITFTIYIYEQNHPNATPDQALDREMESAVYAIQRHYAQARLLSVGQAQVERNGESVPVRQAVLTYEKPGILGNETQRTETLLFAHDDLFYKYRVTYPDHHRHEAQELTVELFEKLVWPKED